MTDEASVAYYCFSQIRCSRMSCDICEVELPELLFALQLSMWGSSVSRDSSKRDADGYGPHAGKIAGGIVMRF